MYRALVRLWKRRGSLFRFASVDEGGAWQNTVITARNACYPSDAPFISPPLRIRVLYVSTN